jgi:3-hydroxyacyl-CoA dehydrogenase/enoyl-CoA hydratase/3-hydroxybutyryl-CoA epimerase
MRNINFRIQDNVAIVEFDLPDSKVNILSTPVMKELQDIINELKDKSGLKGILFTSAKPGIFIAGADIKEIQDITTSEIGIGKSREGQKILNELEALRIPSLALINGACMGGGFEFALACDYRLTTFSEKIKIGLPEIKLGGIPGFGGTKRFPQIVGLRKALECILEAKIFSGKDALKMGAVDGIVPEQVLFQEGIAFLDKVKGRKKIKKPKIKGILNLFLDRTFLGRLILVNQARKTVLKTTKGFYPAPLEAIEVIYKNYTSSLSTALDRESRVFGELIYGEISKNLIRLFYLMEKYKKKKWVDAVPKEIHKCGILGAGVMGGGIAQLISFYDLAVRMKDLNYAALANGLRAAREVFDYAVKKKRIKSHDALFKMGLISPTVSYSGFSNADLIIEAVIEDINIKKRVFTEISKVAKASAVLASNTSALSIDRMADGALDPSRVVGMHFFNPVHKMPLIEVIRGRRTSDEAVATIVEFSRRLGKTPVVVKDACGFLINRILVPYLNEAGYMLEEGMNFENIDKIITGFGMPMGPFTLLDEIGLDIGYKVAKILEGSFGERMKVCSVLDKIYQNKWFGKKTKKGFYIYKNKKVIANSQIYNLISENKKISLSGDDILMRIVCIMINEAARCLEEGVCSESSDVDIGMIMGTGFPPFRGGLLRYADTLGVNKIVDKLREFENRFSAIRFRPCGYLIKLAENKTKFYL